MRPDFSKSRRRLLKALMVVPPAAMALPGLTLAAVSGTLNKRFVLVILRGAMDGIAAVVPYGDPALKSARAVLVPPETELRKLDGFFALHPSFANLHGFYQQSQLLICHAVASPYRERSHFDGQNVLETGALLPDPSATGWLNRCVPVLQGTGGNVAMALGQTVPAVLQGTAAVASWAPALLPAPSDSTMERLRGLYAADAFLGPRLEQALMADELAGADAMSGGRTRARNFSVLVDAAARFLAQPEGPRLAVLENNGWDTHANQGAAQGQLARKFMELDAGLARLKQGLGPVWADTVVAVVTEFGRTVAVNGTQGTDHGTAGVAFLLGGAIRGGRIETEWPGLTRGSLYQGRDLQATMDLRAVFKSVLRDHLGLAMEAIEQELFPGSAAAPYLRL